MKKATLMLLQSRVPLILYGIIFSEYNMKDAQQQSFHDKLQVKYNMLFHHVLLYNMRRLQCSKNPPTFSHQNTLYLSKEWGRGKREKEASR